MTNDSIIIEAGNDNKDEVRVKSYKMIVRMKFAMKMYFCIVFTNIAEKWSVSAPKSIGSPSEPDQDGNTLLDTIEYYINHPSIKQ